MSDLECSEYEIRY